MKRPRQHIIETESETILKSILPSRWATNKVELDYGIDFMVEIFDSANQSTGQFFFIQLKGSDQKIDGATFKRQFDIDNLKYFAAQPLPCLIVCVSTTQKKVWAIWSNKLLQSLEIKDNQKSATITLDSDKIIGDNFFLDFEKEFGDLNHIGVQIDYDDTFGKLLSNNISNYIERFYGDTFVVNKPYLPKQFCLDFSKEEDDYKIILSGPFYKDIIEIQDTDEVRRILMRPVFNENDINIANAEILKSLIKAFFEDNIKGSLELLKRIVSNNNHLTDIEEVISMNPFALLKLSIQNDSLDLFNDVIKLFLRNGLIQIYSFIDLSYLTFSKQNDKINEYRIENLKFGIENSRIAAQKGTLYYNLGNVKRGLGRNQCAISCYFKARKLEPDYLNRAYWWRELAGLMFVTEHYKYAELFYKNFLKNSKKGDYGSGYIRVQENKQDLEILTKGLIGDCLFLQGKFSEAKEWIGRYQKAKNNYYDGFALKKWMSEKLIDLGFDNLKLERKKSMSIVVAFAENKSSEKLQVAQLKKAIKMDPTNNFAWFNLGVSQNRNGKTKDSFYAFLMSGLLKERDKEAQFNSLVIAILEPGYELFLHPLIYYIKSLHGKKVINDLSDHVMNQKYSFELKNILIEKMTIIFEEFRMEE